MTRDEHLAWAKQRAYELLDQGEWVEAMTSMMSDMEKHDETRGHPGGMIGTSLMVIGSIHDVATARHFIDGYH